MRLLLLFSLLFSVFQIKAQNVLRVASSLDWVTQTTESDPNWHENAAPGAFDEVTLVVRPQGIYTQVDLFAEISQGDAVQDWWGGDFEIIWQFDLPAHAVVHDSWLWVGEEIVKADVVDYWTATQIYEDIVERNEDPSLLRKLSNGKHEIRIYPLFDGEYRKIKMSFLLPAVWTADKVYAEILPGLLHSTPYVPETVDIIVPKNDEWLNPHIDYVLSENYPPYHPSVFETLDFAAEIDAFYGPIHRISAPLAEGDYELSSLRLYTDAPWSADQTYLKTYEENGEKYYQLAYRSSWSAGTTDTTVQHVTVLFDRKPEKTDITKAELANKLYSRISETYTSADYFTMMTTTDTGV